MQGNEGTRRRSPQHNARWVDAPRVALFGMRSPEKPHSGFRVVHPAQHRFLQGGFQIEEIVDAETVADGRGDVSHARQILAQGNHVHPVVASSQEKSTVGQNDHRSVVLHISCGSVDVHVQFFVGPRRTYVGAVHHPLRDLHLIEHPVAVPKPVALPPSPQAEAHHPQNEDSFFHGCASRLNAANHWSRSCLKVTTSSTKK